ncbi:MAG: hypothetical protein GX640_06595 [Fibrobacter sp.]|nr:hypothetical protein [Fibrobacter sp.]
MVDGYQCGVGFRGAGFVRVKVQSKQRRTFMRHLGINFIRYECWFDEVGVNAARF